MTPTDLFRHSVHGRGLAEIRQVTVADGPGTGGRLIELRTASGLTADIALDRGGDLLRLAFRGQEVGWHSATRAPSPWPDAEAEHGLGFLRGFDGFLVTCGLDHHGVPAETNAEKLNYPLRKTNVHPLHGRIATQKAELLQKDIDWEADTAQVTLRVQQASVFGEVLELRRSYLFSLSQPRLEIHDRVTNRSFRPARHGILYHVNIGYPTLNPETRLTGDQWALRDRLDDGSASPCDNHVEIVDTALSPQDGQIGLRGGNGLSLRLGFDPGALPVTALWRAFQSGVFALGLEPQTDFEDTEKSWLQGGEFRDYRLSIAVQVP